MSTDAKAAVRELCSSLDDLQHEMRTLRYRLDDLRSEIKDAERPTITSDEGPDSVRLDILLRALGIDHRWLDGHSAALELHGAAVLRRFI